MLRCLIYHGQFSSISAHFKANLRQRSLPGETVGCSQYPSTDKCVGRTTIYPSTLSVKTSSFPQLPYQREDRSGRKGGMQREAQQASLWCQRSHIWGYKGLVNQTTADLSSHVQSSACFLKAAGNTPPCCNKGSLHPSSTGHLDKQTKHTPVLLLMDTQI